jgi:hypothetical protein
MSPRSLAVLAVVALCGEADAGGHARHGACCVPGVCVHEYQVRHDHPVDPARAARYRASHTPTRAGFPLCLSRHAEPSVTHRYGGYFVGGGSAHGGDPRGCGEGTWGWDTSSCLPCRVRLGWSHGRRVQGGTGAYKVDGPEVPNVFNYRPRFHRDEEPSHP